MQPTIGSYLLDELYQHGVHHVFGIPGDYVLKLDKLIEEHPLSFINATQEIHAGYMADAYARLRGLGAVAITYGVGLGALNAVAGSFVEDVPVVAISGSPGLAEVAKFPRRHHLLGEFNENSNAQVNLFSEVTAYQGWLHDPNDAQEKIQTALFTAINEKKPVYLELPRDRVNTALTSHCKNHPMKMPIADPEIEEILKSELEKLLRKMKKPLLWLGHEVLRWNLSQEITSFASRLHLPVITSLLGKGAIDEHHPLFSGIYLGALSDEHLQKYVAESDGCLMIGVMQGDLDMGGFSARVDFPNLAVAEKNEMKVGKKSYSCPLPLLVKVLSSLDIDRFKRAPCQAKKSSGKEASYVTRLFDVINESVTHEHLIVTDVGDCLFAGSELKVGIDSFVSTSYFAALGYGVPAAIGAAFARPDKRIIAIVGDGGFQMSGTELTTAVRYGLDPIVIVLNNHGYGTERPLLEGRYNDLCNWNYSALPKLLGKGMGTKVTDLRELKPALKKALDHRGEFSIIEIELGKTEFSPILHRLTRLLGAG